MVIPNMDSRFLLLIAAVFLGVWAIARAMRTQRFPLKNKVALITGGSRGLGLVLARQICGEGGKVALIARDPDELARAKADLVGRGGVALTVQCDLLDSEQIQSAVRQIMDRFAKFAILIIKPGFIEFVRFQHMEGVNLKGACHLIFWA